MVRRFLNRALAAVAILFAAAAALMLGVALAGPNGAGAAPGQTSTTSGGPCIGAQCGSTPPTTVPVASTAPATTAPRTTSPPTTRAAVRQTFPPRTTVPASTTSTTNTTLPSIGGNLPVTPSTVPFTTKQQSSHVSPVFAALSGIGFFLALIIAGVRFWITRPPHQPPQ